MLYPLSPVIISGHRESESEKETRSFHPWWPPQPPEINIKIVCHIWSVLSTTFAWSLSPVIVKVKVEKETEIDERFFRSISSICIPYSIQPVGDKLCQWEWTKFRGEENQRKKENILQFSTSKRCLPASGKAVVFCSWFGNDNLNLISFFWSLIESGANWTLDPADF